MANPNGPGWGVADAQFNGAMDWWRSLSAAEKQGYNDMYYGATMLIYPTALPPFPCERRRSGSTGFVPSSTRGSQRRMPGAGAAGIKSRDNER